MANPKHIAVVDSGSEAVNQWRVANPGVRLDLKGVDFSRRSLSGLDLSFADMVGCNLEWSDCDFVNFAQTDLTSADLRCCGLSGTNASNAIFRNAKLGGANAGNYEAVFLCTNFLGADLSHGNLSRCNFTAANLSDCNLTGTKLESSILKRVNLERAVFRDTIVAQADFTDALLGGNVFANVAFESVKGLNSCRHSSPSTIGVDTIISSRRQISSKFLLDCGLPLAFCEKLIALVCGNGYFDRM